MNDLCQLLDESEIPKHMLNRARIWFSAQVKRLETLHGDQWRDHKEWIADYLNAEVKELIVKNS